MTTTEAIHNAYQHLENAGLVPKVTVHRYQCGKCGKVLATVIRLGDNTIARTVDYKYSRGLNRASRSPQRGNATPSTASGTGPAAPTTSTRWRDCGPQAGFDVVCRHVTTTVAAVDVLALTRDAKPGHPGKPTRL